MPPYNGKILVVDDEKDFVNIIKDYFSNEGYEMLTAHNGEEALNIASQKQPWLMLLDIKMPGINGIEVLKRIRKERIGTKVIIITAYDEENRKIVEDIGVEGFLSKPCGVGMLEEKINQLVREQTRIDGIDKNKKAKAKLLFVESDKCLCESLKEYFSNPDKCYGNYELTFVDTKEGIEEYLEKFKPDFALINYSTSKNANFLTQVMKSKNKPRETIGWGLDMNNHHERIAAKIYSECKRLGLVI